MSLKLGVSYFSSRMAEHFAKDLEKMKNSGLNQILLTYSENDLEFYTETIKEFVTLSKANGFEVYIGPWTVGGVFGGEAYSEYTARYYPERQLLNNGDRPPSACVNNPHFREFFHKWIKSAVYCGADTIFLDEPHFFIPGWKNNYPKTEKNVWGCLCRHCRDLFQARYGKPMPEMMTDEVDEFKRNCIMDFIRFSSKKVKEENPNVKVSVCLVTNEHFLKTDLPYITAEIEELDEIATDPYWGENTGDKLDSYLADEFTGGCRVLKNIADKYGKKTQIWIKNFLVKSGTEYAIEKGIDISLKYNITNIMAWSYNGTRYMSGLSCEDPDKVWQTLISKFKRISS